MFVFVELTELLLFSSGFFCFLFVFPSIGLDEFAKIRLDNLIVVLISFDK